MKASEGFLQGPSVFGSDFHESEIHFPHECPSPYSRLVDTKGSPVGIRSLFCVSLLVVEKEEEFKMIYAIVLHLSLYSFSYAANAPGENISPEKNLRFLDGGISAVNRKKFKTASLEFLDALKSCTSWNMGIPCFKIYTKEHEYNEAWVELCSKSGKWKPGIYRVLEDAVKYYPTFDAKFFDWSCDGECEKDSSGKSLCYYESLGDKKSRQILYHYEIIFTVGDYVLDVEPNRLKVVRHSSEDIENVYAPVTSAVPDPMPLKEPPKAEVENTPLKQKLINILLKIRGVLSSIIVYPSR